MTRTRLHRAASAVCMCVGLLAACAKSPSTAGERARGALAIQVGDTSITAPDSVTAGLTDITVTSTGKGRAHVIVAQLAHGVTFDQIEKASSQEQDRLSTVVGGNGAIASGQSTTVVLDLAAGDYEIVQVAPGNEPSPTHRLRVTPSAGPAVAVPVAKGVVVAKGRSLTLPSGFDGKGTWKVTNNDAKDDHEASVIQIAPGKTAADVVAYFASHDHNGPPPAVAMGGMGDLPPGRSGWMMLNLPVGSYAVACFIPDNAGMLHVAMGMITPFQVA